MEVGSCVTRILEFTQKRKEIHWACRKGIRIKAYLSLLFPYLFIKKIINFYQCIFWNSKDLHDWHNVTNQQLIDLGGKVCTCAHLNFFCILHFFFCFFLHFFCIFLHFFAFFTLALFHFVHFMFCVLCYNLHLILATAIYHRRWNSRVASQSVPRYFNASFFIFFISFFTIFLFKIK